VNSVNPVFDAPQALYLEDLHVGQRFNSAQYHMEADRMKAFAAEFDPQPFHLDEAAAEHTIFHGLAASGWHTAAATMRLLVMGGLPIAGGMIGLSGEMAWPNPTRPGDTLRVESETLEIVPSRSKPDRAVVTFRCVTFNQKGEKVQIMTTKIMVFRRPVPTP
jgi:acyl dehydratase